MDLPEERGRPMQVVESNDIFEENDRRVLQTLTRVMRWLWFSFSLIYVGNIVHLFQIDYFELNVVTAIAFVILWLPTFVDRLQAPLVVRRYFCVLGMGQACISRIGNVRV